MSYTRPVTRSYFKPVTRSSPTQWPAGMSQYPSIDIGSPIIVTYNDVCVKDTPVHCQNEVPSKASTKNAHKNKSKSATVQLTNDLISSNQGSKKRTICTSIEYENPAKKSKSDNCLATATRTIQTRGMSKKMVVPTSGSTQKKHRKSHNFVTPSPGLLKSTSKRRTNKMSVAYVNLNTSQDMDKLSCSSLSSGSEDAKFVDEKHKLPKGVVDIDEFLSKPEMISSRCTCHHHDDHNSGSSQNEAYLSSYGKEYHCQLLATEQRDFGIDCSASISSLSGFSYLSSSPTSSTSKVRRSERLQNKSLRSSSIDSDKSQTSSPFSMGLSTYNSKDNKMTPNATARKLDYLDRHNSFNKEVRIVLIDWLIEVADEYNLKSITLHTSISLVDRSLNCSKFDGDYSDVDYDSSDDDESVSELVVNRYSIQLLGCACMLIACKLHETDNHPKTSDFCFISAESYRRSQISSMEAKVCAVLRFRLNYVTSTHYTDRFLRASYASSYQVTSIPCSIGIANTPIRYMVDYLLEIALLNYHFVSLRPSLVAAVALYLSRATLGIKDVSSTSLNDGIWSKTLEYYTGYDVDTLKDPVLRLHKHHRKAEDHKFRAVYLKYSKKMYKKVALKTVASELLLGFS